MIERIFTAAERDSTLQDAYAVVSDLADVLDVSKAGLASWEGAKKAYNERVDRLESQIIVLSRGTGLIMSWGPRGTPFALVANMFLWGTGGMHATQRSPPCTPGQIGNPSPANTP